MPERTLYDLLGVTPDATPGEIEAAHRRQLKYWHPDRNKGTDADRRAKSINHAYDVLSDPAQRADYQRSLVTGAPPPPPDASPDAGPPPWTPPPGRYRRRRSSRTGSAGSTSAGSGPTSAGARPPPPTGIGWGYRFHGSRVELLLRQSRAAIGWLVQPLRQPALTRRFVGAMIVRVAALAVTAGLLWLVVPVLVAAVQFVVGLLALAAMITLFALALGSKGSRRRRRR